eukprot:377224_1
MAIMMLHSTCMTRLNSSQMFVIYLPSKHVNTVIICWKRVDKSLTVWINTLSLSLQNSIIDLYGQYGLIKEAQDVYNGMTCRDSHTLGSMMNMYLNNSLFDDCLQMYSSNSHALYDDVTTILAIKACINCDDYKQGVQIHQSLVAAPNNQLKNVLICFYGHFGDVDTAVDILNSINDKGHIDYGAMMKAYIDNGYNHKALILYNSILNSHDAKYDVCKMLAVKACTNMNDFEQGNEIILAIHSLDNVQLQNMLIDFYGHPKHCDVQNALKMFDSISDDKKDIVSIRAMMSAFHASQLNTECLILFNNIESMYHMEPNLLCYKIIFGACGDEGWLTVGDTIKTKLDLDTEHRWILSQTDIQ